MSFKYSSIKNSKLTQRVLKEQTYRFKDDNEIYPDPLDMKNIVKSLASRFMRNVLKEPIPDGFERRNHGINVSFEWYNIPLRTLRDEVDEFDDESQMITLAPDEMDELEIDNVIDDTHTMTIRLTDFMKLKNVFNREVGTKRPRDVGSDIFNDVSKDRFIWDYRDIRFTTLRSNLRVGGSSIDNNCLLKCFKTKLTREQLNLPPEPELLSIQHACDISQYLNVKLTILSGYTLPELDSDCNYSHVTLIPTIIKEHNINGHGDLWIELIDEHYKIYKPRSTYVSHYDKSEHTSLKRVKLHNKTLINPFVSEFVIFDIETVNYKGKTVPYSLSFCYTDTLTDICKDNVINYFGFGCVKNFLSYIRCNKAKFIVAFNGSKFDFFMLFKQCLTTPDVHFNKYNMIVGGTCIKRFTFNGMTTLDIAAYTCGSLDVLCSKFNKTFFKKPDIVNHDDIQLTFDKYGLKGLNKEVIIEYNAYDVLSLAELTHTIRRTLIDKTGEVGLLDRSVSLSGFIYSYWLKSNTTNIVGSEYTIPVKRIGESLLTIQSCKSTSNIDYSTYRQIRDGIVAGRVQSFNGKQRELNGDHVSIDAVSLYPFIMLSFDYPCGNSKWTDEYDNISLGFALTEIFEQQLPLIRPLRVERLDWTHTGHQSPLLITIPELKAMQDRGDKVKVHKYLLFDGRCRPFNILNSFAKSKLNETDVIKRDMDKLCMNSLSGKMLQKISTSSMDILKSNHGNKCKDYEYLKINNDTVLGFLDNDEKDMYSSTGAKPVWIASYIYAYARLYMYNSIYSKIDTLYTDTDSALIKKKDYLKCKHIDNTFIIDNIKITNPLSFNQGLGAFIIDFDNIVKYYLISPKTYLLIDRDNNNKIRMKTVNPNTSKTLLPYENMSIESIYDSLFNGISVHFTSMQFKRSELNISICKKIIKID